MSMEPGPALTDISSMKIGNLPKVQLPVKQLEEAVDTAKKVESATAPAVHDAFEHAKEAAEHDASYAWGVGTSSEAWGESIGVDNSFTAPRRFDYGSTKKTLAE